MRNKIFLAAVAVLTLTLAAPAQAVTFAPRPVVSVFTSANRITDQETVTVTALATTPTGEPVDSIEVQVDNQRRICSDTFYCQMTGGPFFSGVKRVAYVVTAINKSDKLRASRVVKRGSIIVRPGAANNRPPQFSRIITSKHQLQVGEKFDAIIYAKANSNVSKIEVYLDGGLKRTCENTNVCGATFGPFVASDAGEHKYSFKLTGANGKTSEPWGKFWVKGADADAASTDSGGQSQVAPKVSVSADKTSALSTDQITFTAKADAKMSKINILINQKLVKECDQTGTCVYTGGPYPEFVGSWITYGANVYSENGNHSWTGYKAVKISAADASATSTLVVEPTITLSLSANQVLPGEKVTVTAKVEPGSKAVKQLVIYQQMSGSFDPTGPIIISLPDLKLPVKTCDQVNTCEVSAEVSASFANYFSAKAYFTDGTSKETAAQSVAVTVPEPVVTVAASKDAVSVGEKFDLTAKVEPNGKIVDKIIIKTVYGLDTPWYLPGFGIPDIEGQYECKQASTCSLESTGSVYFKGFSATAYFTDGTNKSATGTAPKLQ